jgi:hypothetical protein
MAMRNQIKSAAVLLTMLLSVSCSGMESAQHDSELLRSAINTFKSKQQFVYEIESVVKVGANPEQKAFAYQGLMTGNDQLFIKQTGGGFAAPLVSTGSGSASAQGRDQWVAASGTPALQSALIQQWSPLTKFDQLNQIDNTVSRVRDEKIQGNETVLKVEVPPEVMKQLVLADLREQISHVQMEERLKEAAAKGLAPDAIQRMKLELEQAAAESEVRLSQMASSLTTQGYYMLWINRDQELPRKLVIRSDLNYMLNDKEKKESVTTTYEFKDYDKQVILPQT